MVMDSQIAEFAAATRRSETSHADAGRRLAALIAQRRPTESAKGLFSAASDMLVEASTADRTLFVSAR